MIERITRRASAGEVENQTQIRADNRADANVPESAQHTFIFPSPVLINHMSFLLS